MVGYRAREGTFKYSRADTRRGVHTFDLWTLKDPADAWPELELIMPEACAEIALKGLDLDLFYIPTQAHILDDMQPRVEGVRDALQKLGVKPAG